MGAMWKRIRRRTENKMSLFNMKLKYLPDGGNTHLHKEERRNGRPSKGISPIEPHLPETPEEPWSKVNSDAVTTPDDRAGLDRRQTATHPKEEVEVIKVFLESRRPVAERHRESVKMLTDEVSHIQEVRYCLKSLREQMAVRQNQKLHSKRPANDVADAAASQKPQDVPNGHHTPADSENTAERSQESTRRLSIRLQEAEDRHQEDRDRLQAENATLQRRLEERSGRLQQAEGLSEERGWRVEELERQVDGLQVESAGLREQLAAAETELGRLRERGEQGTEEERRSEELEKNVAILKEKILQLDDMLKSQQRKVRHMIEQLQNSRTVLQERDRIIQELEEKVAFLEAENREMHDHVDYLTGEQDPPTPPLTSPEDRPQVVYSEPLKPTAHHNSKPLPYIKFIELKS